MPKPIHLRCMANVSLELKQASHHMAVAELITRQRSCSILKRARIDQL